MSKDARIGTLCPQCGEVELGVEQVWLVVATVADFSHYGFHCPGCGDRVHHAANSRRDRRIVRARARRGTRHSRRGPGAPGGPGHQRRRPAGLHARARLGVGTVRGAGIMTATTLSGPDRTTDDLAGRRAEPGARTPCSWWAPECWRFMWRTTTSSSPMRVRQRPITLPADSSRSRFSPWLRRFYRRLRPGLRAALALAAGVAGARDGHRRSRLLHLQGRRLGG